MERIIKIFLLMSLISICSNIVFGQLVSDKYCKEFENAVAMPLNPVHWYHNIVFEDDCWLEFDIDVKGGVGLSFKLEKSETKKKARKSLHSDIEMYKNSDFIATGKDSIITKLSKNNFWDEAYFFESNSPMLLRREKTFITVFCDKREFCLQTEKALREVSALKEN